MNKSDLRHVKEYFDFFKNPIKCLFFKFGFLKKCNVKIKNYNNEIEINKKSSIDKLVIGLSGIDSEKFDDFLKFIKDADSDKEVITINDYKIINNKNTTFAEFFSIDFWNIDVKNRRVIDIGANVGDTALYFLSKGAKEVISFEPVKELFEIGLKNIALNPKFNDKVKFFNKAVSCKKGKMNIQMDSTAHYITEEDNYEVDVITINDILKDYGATPDILKMDCEGCEFGVILNTDLSMFNDIIFEHHSTVGAGKYDVLVDKLKSEGFSTKFFKVLNKDFDRIGIIHAFK